ncbi:MAG: thioredoxin fold domain-containing protein [Bacteroidota bacterium]
MKFLLFWAIFLCPLLESYSFDKGPSDNGSKSKASGIVFFKGTLSQALKKAKVEGKMVFIDSYTVWCGPCKHLKNNIFPDENFSKFINENYVPMSINIEKGEGPKIKRKYPHYTFPTLLFIKNDGKLKNRFVGLPTYGAQELLNFAILASK